MALCTRIAAPATTTADTNSRKSSGCGASPSLRSPWCIGTSTSISSRADPAARASRIRGSTTSPDRGFLPPCEMRRAARLRASRPVSAAHRSRDRSRRLRALRDGIRHEDRTRVEEHSIEEQPRAARKKARPPVRFTEDEAPFGRREVALDRPELDDAGRSRLLRRDDAEAGVQPAPSLRPRPADEATKVLHGRRTRRDVPKDARVVQVRKQRWRVLQSKLAQNHAAVVQQRQASTPLTAASDGRSGIGYVLMYRHVGSVYLAMRSPLACSRLLHDADVGAMFRLVRLPHTTRLAVTSLERLPHVVLGPDV